MILRKLFFLTLLVIHYLLFTNSCFAQNNKKIDSLQNELIKFEANKRELGTKATLLMDSTKANLLYDIARQFWWDRGNNNDSVLSYVDQLLVLSENIGYKMGIGNAYNGRGLVYMGMHNYQLAMDYFQKALTIRTAIDDKVGLGWTYNDMGMVSGMQDNLSEAIKYHLKSLKVKEGIGDKIGMAQSYGKIGHLFFELGNFPEALKNYFSALKLGEETGNKNQIAVSYGDIGQIYYIEGNYAKALEYHQGFLKIGVETNDKIILAAAYAYLGNISQKQGNDTGSVRNQLASLKIYNELNDHEGSSFSNYNLGLVYLSMKNYKEALSSFNLSLKEYEVLDGKAGIATDNIQIGEVYKQQGNFQEALKYELKGLHLAATIGAKDIMKESYDNLSVIYAEMQNYKEAYQYHVLYQQLKDSLFNNESAGKMKGLQMQYDFDKDEALQKAEQDKKDILAAKEVEKIKFRRNTIFLVMAIIVAFLIILIILRNRIANERRQKSIEQERSRISRDLHDDLGSGLISIFMMSEQIQNPDNKELITSNVEKIKQSSKLMIDQMRIIIWAMNSLNDTLENLIIYMESYSKDYFENLPVKFNIDILENIPKNEMSGMVRRNIFLVVKESLNNINRHSKATEVTISVSGNREEMYIVISDNGIGFNVEETRRFGNGLKNMNNRMKDLNGKFVVESILGKGTKTFINFPLA